MKKFKTSADKKALEQKVLEDILAEDNLLFNVFVRYTHLPLGLIVALLVLLTSYLAHRPVFSFENALLMYMGIAAVSLFYMSKTWFAFRKQRAKLQHVRNAFVGSAVYPLLFSALMLFLAIPLGKTVIVCVLGLFLLISLYHYKETFAATFSSGAGAIIFGLYFALLLWIPILSPAGEINLAAAGLTAVVALVFAVLFLRLKKVLFLSEKTYSEELIT